MRGRFFMSSDDLPPSFRTPSRHIPLTAVLHDKTFVLVIIGHGMRKRMRRLETRRLALPARAHHSNTVAIESVSYLRISAAFTTIERGSMYKILEKTQFSEKVFKFRVEAPAMAKHAHAGQFLMVRANECGERVPFTLAGWNADEGWVEFIFMVIGKTTEMLSAYEAGYCLPRGQAPDRNRPRGARHHGRSHQGPAAARGSVPRAAR